MASGCRHARWRSAQEQVPPLLKRSLMPEKSRSVVLNVLRETCIIHRTCITCEDGQQLSVLFTGASQWWGEVITS